MFSIPADIFILVVLLVFSAFFSASEVSLVSLNRLRVRRMLKENLPGAKKVDYLKNNPRKMLATILIGNNVVNTFAAAFVTLITIDFFGDAYIGIATGALTFILLVFCEITPKSLAIMHAAKFSRFAAGPIYYLSIIFTPIVWALDFFANLLANVLGGMPISQATVTRDELSVAATLGHEEGVINKEEKEMIHRVLQFNNKTVGEVMTPRIEMVSIDAEQTLGEFVELFIKEPFSRIPAYEPDSPDKIAGIIYAKEAIAYLSKGKKDVKIRSILRPAYFVPANKMLDSLFRDFKKKHLHIAIVIDEYGGILGMITMDDLLEEIVGDITDEMEDEPKIEKIDEKTYDCEGITPIDKVNELLHTNLASKRYDTVGGWLLEHLGRLPKQGESIIAEGLEITAKKLSGARIEQVRIAKK